MEAKYKRFNPPRCTVGPNAPAKRGNRTKVANENLPQQQKLPEQLLSRRQTADRRPRPGRTRSRGSNRSCLIISRTNERRSHLKRPRGPNPAARAAKPRSRGSVTGELTENVTVGTLRSLGSYRNAASSEWRNRNSHPGSGCQPLYSAC